MAAVWHHQAGILGESENEEDLCEAIVLEKGPSVGGHSVKRRLYYYFKRRHAALTVNAT
jgi:hypothetical protein